MRLLSLAACLLLTPFANAETPPSKYHNAAELSQILRDAKARAPQLLDVKELAKDSTGQPIWLVEAGSRRDSDPAILLVGGLDGRHLVGTEMLLALVDDLTTTPTETAEFLSSTTLYLMPRVNTSAAEKFFASPREEQSGLAAKRDADHDGSTSEDMADDLDGDGQIASLRYEDPRGTLVTDGENGELLRDAKSAEGEVGRWVLVSEGIDNDGDESFNEEADAGVNLARNFPIMFEWFGRNSGLHGASEPETRAIADFIAGHPRIAAVVVYGPEDNMLTSPPGDKSSNPDKDQDGARKPVELPNKADLPYIRRIGELYRKDLGLKKEVGVSNSSTAAKGSLGAYAYFARGRLALSTPVWTPEMQVALLKDATKDEEKRLKKFEDVKNEQRFLDWVKATDAEAWRGWKPVAHPFDATKKAEAGGLAPFAKINPPAAILGDLATTHTMFVRRLVTQLPRTGLENVTLRPTAGGVYVLHGWVANNGYLPDVLGHGNYSSHVRATRIEIDPGKGEVLGANDRVMVKPLAGSGGREEFRLMLRIPGDAPEVKLKLVTEAATSQELTVSVTEPEASR
jgi:hypothetical protein